MNAQNIEEENKNWNTNNQAPSTKQFFRNNQNDESKEDWQMGHAGHKLWIQEVCFNQVDNDNHDDNVDNVTNATD